MEEGKCSNQSLQISEEILPLLEESKPMLEVEVGRRMPKNVPMLLGLWNCFLLGTEESDSPLSGSNFGTNIIVYPVL